MPRLADFAALPHEERALLGTTAALLATSRLLLPLIRLDATRRAVERLACGLPPYRSISDPDRVPWAVEVADATLPASFTCLMRALVAQSVLADQGYRSRLRYGVKTEVADLKAHAWVERSGQVVVGDLDDLSDYRCLRGDRTEL